MPLYFFTRPSPALYAASASSILSLYLSSKYFRCFDPAMMFQGHTGRELATLAERLFHLGAHVGCVLETVDVKSEMSSGPW